MKICFSVEEDKGLDSQVFGHFGLAPAFLVFDTQTKALETVDNQDLGHDHGMCNPLKALDGKTVDAIVVGGIGAGAINKLNSKGVKVYRARQGTVKFNIDLFTDKKQTELKAEHGCAGHGGGCGH
ncbi:MAG: NifB/NifX family molybdenum-iron cluster-binding protein [Candidatus Omnitrophica bacterium]|nr:NifB/NifX family molybdenum-iron cluster-binding protein [Candidatus Omnitrophota bacterium]